MPTITFKWKIGKREVETTVTPSNPTTGVYTVDVVPGADGNLHARWDTEGAYDVVAEPIINIKESAFTV